MKLTSKVRELVSRMVEIESSSSPDWCQVESLADRALSIVAENQLGEELDPYIIKFLDDLSIRKDEHEFGEHQRQKVMQAIQGLHG